MHEKFENRVIVTTGCPKKLPNFKDLFFIFTYMKRQKIRCEYHPCECSFAIITSLTNLPPSWVNHFMWTRRNTVDHVFKHFLDPNCDFRQFSTINLSIQFSQNWVNTWSLWGKVLDILQVTQSKNVDSSLLFMIASSKVNCLRKW